jgi:hypothetical protein
VCRVSCVTKPPSTLRPYSRPHALAARAGFAPKVESPYSHTGQAFDLWVNLLEVSSEVILLMTCESKLAEIKATVRREYSYCDMTWDARTTRLRCSICRRCLRGELGQQLPKTDYGKRYDCQTEAYKADSRKPRGPFVLFLNRLIYARKDVVKWLRNVVR